ncbi:MAG: F0F1 ATP synthase subunit epsilon [Oligoflexia bacterium]|nr:F0F1 ATP synthase subunit epsilon [Oligoflexia bacterium]MBF0366994.1 F0F1 ATP synthase subunit epsilon [Oligoflexia bacterium]
MSTSATQFSVDIYTPDSVAAQGLAADSLLLQSADGEIQILPGHVQLMTKLVSGVIVVMQGKKKYHFATAAGTCRVLENNIYILVKSAEKTLEE